MDDVIGLNKRSQHLRNFKGDGDMSLGFESLGNNSAFSKGKSINEPLLTLEKLYNDIMMIFRFKFIKHLLYTSLFINQKTDPVDPFILFSHKLF